jgi:VWFA-related protein
VPIESFVPPDPADGKPQGRFLVLVMDNVHTRVDQSARVQAIARRFADRMGPTDQVSVITLESGRSTVTSSPAEVRAAIARFRPRVGDSIRSQAEDAAEGLRTINRLSQQMASARHRRKVLVFIGAASMFSPNEPSPFHDRDPDLSAHWFEAIRATARNNVTVYAIDPEGHTGHVDDYSRSFAGETGGEAWVNTNNFDRVVETIWRESGSYYLLGYPAPINDHRIHAIEVRTTVPGVRVRARRARG